jgi:hypothetical protein
MHDQYSARLDDDDNENSSYSSSRPLNIDCIRDDNIDDDDDASGRDDDISWNDDSAAYASRLCIMISSFDGMLL